MVIGLICAMPQEISLLEKDIKAAKETVIAGRSFFKGTLYGKDVVLVMSRIGKVATAITTTLLLEQFDVDCVVFSGTAGGLDPALNVGDVVIGSRSVQHDFAIDPTPTFRVPGINISYFESDPDLTHKAGQAAGIFLTKGFTREVSAQARSQFGIVSPKTVTGTIASGDQFITSIEKNRWIYDHVEDAKCAEMEGAAMAQVCYEYKVPFTIVRVISDSANSDSFFAFDAFVEDAAQYFTRGTVRELLGLID